ncbi:aspartate--tRNA ligase [Enterococcus cecorum]|uniref:Aspartate--tRNA ligase n=2 Tax=Enterococcus cecorum DSM 20682 = ATCC 43198 TaxID=1121864 RepID=S1QUC7_9ENTE|nr:aspartate--tRNA ligase [Enterococcus cecorum]EOX17371.1 aspartyl-tRNA synthetase [Enterococcus cecorum DSM 20682 = ATCC 43198]ESK60541.1 aspartyl-tRNA synthetase [Enterococcus cecorum DSM 20682 = ATCC 43198]OJG30356.1 aspartyl-tRNA synthetase [Enterococcus cecorum DSM 20682 = ATCC 43198]CAI3489279.1 aspartate--tRNA ligase [Enterococcus cecorum DSM 20682 = ATCC 43198]SQE54134.1 aspartyl-tRNA synthetase [Enterococcus cecorum]
MATRTLYCGQVSNETIGQTVTLKGWVQKRRDLGGVIFIDLRDREGFVQVVFNPAVSKEAWAIADKCRSEYVIEVTGEVIERASEAVNPKIVTGGVEVMISDITILNKAKTPPFPIEDDQQTSDEVPMRYRYLDLRRPKMTQNIILRNQVTRAIRTYLDSNDFLDIETPYLGKSTPEGARDYLVPSRVHPGHFYALPQSPQIFKQLLMNAGFDRYYQIVRCFRDEDLRGDRQPEFTQVDMETSFLSAEEIQTLTEGMIAKVMKDVKGMEVTLPFPRMTYDEAMNRYGSDKPDTRFDMELVDISEVVKDIDFKVFQMALENGGVVKALNAKGAADKYSRKDMDNLGQFAGQYGAKGLAWLKVEADGLKGPIAKFLGDATEKIVAATNAEVGDLLMFGADSFDVVCASLGAVRLKLGKELGLIDESKFNFLWVVDWPQFEYDKEEGRYVSAHHPFTLPRESDIPLLATDPSKVHAQAYDIVLNGYELGGGSLRIYQKEVQEKMFEALGFSRREMQEQFGFLLDALDYGFPPHGGIALGLDRFVMLLAGEDNIREVIAFPKNGRAVDPMSQAPSTVSPLQLFELNIDVTGVEED